jgi:hypothetical protein
MKLSRRRLSFQLTPLLDLLLIVIFAQYMEVQQTADTQASEVAEQLQAAELNAELARLQLLAKLEVAEQERARLQVDSNRLKSTMQERETEINEELRQTRQEILELGEVLSRLFRLPRETIEQLLSARTEAERTELRREIEKMAGGRAAEMVKHLRTWRELLKRCDVWDIHIGDDNSTTMTAAGKTFRFRAETPERFEAEIYARYKALPQPKNLVVLLVSWSDAQYSVRQAAITGVAAATQRMHEDSDRRTRFEYAILGFSPPLQ